MRIPRKKMLAIAILAAGMVGVAMCAALMYKAHLDNDALAQLPIIQELRTRFAKADPALDVHAQNVASIWWDDVDGYSILVPATESMLFVSLPGQSVQSTNIPKAFFSKELSIAREVFALRGFVLNSTNSSTSTQDVHFYDYVQGYERGDTLCVVTVNPDYSSYVGGGANMGYALTVSCGNALAEAEAQQRPLLDALGKRGQEAVARVLAQDGEFVEVGIGYRRMGETAVLKHEGSTYRVLLLSQEAPPCSFVDAEQIPSDMLSSIGRGGCYTSGDVYREVSI